MEWNSITSVGSDLYLKFSSTESLKILDEEVKITETRCSSLLHKLYFGGRRSASSAMSSTHYDDDLTMNIYKGCSHNCSYCYVPSLIHEERNWGSYVDVKINSPFVPP